jgi:hypothetical protein
VKTVLREIAPGVYEDVNGGFEPLFSLSIEKGEKQYWHQSGYGYLSESRVEIIE